MITESALQNPFDRSVLDEMVEMMGGDTEIVNDIVATWLDEAPALIAAITEGDGDEVRIAAHTLKSSSRSVGAMALGQLCEQIETAHRNDDPTTAASAIAAVAATHDQTVAALAAWTP